MTITAKHMVILVIGYSVVAIGTGFALAHWTNHRDDDAEVVQSDKIDTARQAADAKTYAVEKQSVTVRRQAAKRVADEVKLETTQSDLADYLGAVVDGDSRAPSLGAQGARGDVDDSTHSLAPGDAP